MKKLTLLICLIISAGYSFSQKKQTTYCNPVNIDYGYTPIPGFTQSGRHRATADPVIVRYKNDYYLFSTNQWGYWWSSDMLNWNFICFRIGAHPDGKVAGVSRTKNDHRITNYSNSRRTEFIIGSFVPWP